MPKREHTESYYAASANLALEYPVLQGDMDVDVCVIGAGLTGASAALHLAERGYSVAVLERDRVGWGASGRSGGQKIFGYGCSMGTLRRAVGRDDARRLWDLSIEALRYTDELIGRHGIECDLVHGQVHAAIKPRQVRALLEEKEELEREYGYDGLSFVEGTQLREYVASERYRAVLHDPRSGHLHPLNYTLGLARAAERAGARLFEGTPATRIEPGERVVVQTPQGRVAAKHLVLCANAYQGGLEPRSWRCVMPVGTYMLATEPLGEARARALLPKNSAVSDINFVLDYFRRSADHRLLFGGLVSYSKLPPPNLKGALRANMLKVFPDLADVNIDYAWGGFVAITQNRAPHFGKLGRNVYFAHGYSGHGIALTGLAGRLIAEAVAGTEERFDVFARIPHLPFPGGDWFRTPALVLAMAWYRLRDLLP